MHAWMTKRFAATLYRSNSANRLKNSTVTCCISPKCCWLTREISHGSYQRGHGHHHRRPRLRRQAVAGSRAASAESESREGEVRLLKERQEGGSPGRRQRRVAARRGERDNGLGGPVSGAGRRADVDGGHRAEPGAEQQPAGVDPPRRVRPHLVPLHRLHLHPRRGRRVRRPLALNISPFESFFSSSVLCLICAPVYVCA